MNVASPVVAIVKASPLYLKLYLNHLLLVVCINYLFYQDSNDDISFTFLISKLIPLDGDAAR
jgi:hypothetical protein